MLKILISVLQHMCNVWLSRPLMCTFTQVDWLCERHWQNEIEKNPWNQFEALLRVLRIITCEVRILVTLLKTWRPNKSTTGTGMGSQGIVVLYQRQTCWLTSILIIVCHMYIVGCPGFKKKRKYRDSMPRNDEKMKRYVNEEKMMVFMNIDFPPATPFTSWID